MIVCCTGTNSEFRLAKQLTNELHVAEPSAQDAVDIVATVQQLHEAIHDKNDIVTINTGAMGQTFTSS